MYILQVLFVVVSFALPFIVIVLAMKKYIPFLINRGMLVKDVHKLNETLVPSPAGPLIFLSFLVGELFAYLVTFSIVPLIILATGAVAFLIGIYDDLFILGGVIKPILLVLASIPIVIGEFLYKQVYVPRLYFPLVGSIGEHFTIYTILVILSIPVVSNAFNMMDSFNGEISSFSTITSATIIASTAIKAVFFETYSFYHLIYSLPLLAVSFGFYLYNKYPSKVFDGDSGSLFFGSVFACLAIVNGVELSAVVAIIPAILNSFYILSSLRGFVERRSVKVRPTYLGKDGLLYTSNETGSPNTLVKMILLEKPMNEAEIVKKINSLTLFSCFLSLLTSILTWVL